MKSFFKKIGNFSFPGLEGFTLSAVFNAFKLQLKKTNLSERAGSISFSFLMAIPAATIFLLTLIPLTPLAQSIHQQMQSLIKDITPNENTAKAISNFQSFLDDNLHKTRIGLLSFGIIWMIFSASNAMMGIIRTFDRSVIELRKSNFLIKRWRAIKLTIVMLFMLIATLLILAGQNFLFDKIMDLLEIENETLMWWIRSLRWIVITALFVLGIGTIYKYAPSSKKRMKLLSIGAVFATALIMLFTYLFSLWVNHFGGLNSLYGSIGSVIILMSLIFFNSLVMLVGFELNIAIEHLKRSRRQTQPLF